MVDLSTIFEAVANNKYVELIEQHDYNLNIYSRINYECFILIGHHISCDILLKFMQINEEYYVTVDYVTIFTSGILIIGADKLLIDKIINCISCPTNYNDVLNCFADEPAIKYYCSILDIDYDYCYLYCIKNKSFNTTLLNYLSEYVSDVNMFIPNIFYVVRPRSWQNCNYLDTLLSKGLDCSYINIYDCDIIEVFNTISLDNIKQFCQIKLSTNAYKKIIYEAPSDKLRKFLTYHDEPNKIVRDEKITKYLDIVDELGIPKGNILTYILSEPNGHDRNFDFFSSLMKKN
jgi:hypothetical protein